MSGIEACPVSPFDLLVAASTRVQIYSAKSGEVKRTISRFKDVVHCATWRRDGRLLCASDATGLIQVIDSQSRSILRSFRSVDKTHSELNLKRDDAVRVVKFTSDNVRIVSGGDDRTVRLWDIPSG